MTNDIATERLLGAADIRRIAADAGVSPTKKLGQNFVIDPGTVRRIAREAGVGPGSRVLEVGPGLGSLTLAILETGADLTAVEIDPKLAERLPNTVAEFMPQAVARLTVMRADALTLTPETLPQLASEPFTLVANLPYNVATPILLTLLERFDGLERFLVMVQKEVADRLVARPGSKTYGAPSVKLAWYGNAERAGLVGRGVFWPAPNVDSALVSFTRYTNNSSHDNAIRPCDAANSTQSKTSIQMVGGRRKMADAQNDTACEILQHANMPSSTRNTSSHPNEDQSDMTHDAHPTAQDDAMNDIHATANAATLPLAHTEALRQKTFQLIDLAFGQRRKTLHAALRNTLSAADFETAGIDPTRRGETLTVDEFAALASVG